LQHKYNSRALSTICTPYLLNNSNNKSMTNHHLQSQQKDQSTHFSYKQNETNEAIVLAILVFISLIIFAVQS
jgi:hypothetical protein